MAVSFGTAGGTFIYVGNRSCMKNPFETLNRRRKNRWAVSLALSVLGVSTLNFSAAGEGDEHLMTEPEARKFMLDLINKDRAAYGLTPVRIDPVAQAAGEKHAQEMAENVYMAHWDLLGRKPWERYNEVGGRASVAENVAFVGTNPESGSPPQSLPLLSPQVFPKKALAEMEEAMVTEKPPEDGHRKNILNSNHNGVGIGLAVSADGGTSRVVLDQEFTDDYGTFGAVPRVLPVRTGLKIDGSLARGVKISNILLDWEPTPRAMSPRQLNTTHSYDWPTTTLEACWPPGFRTDAPVQISTTGDRQTFSVTMPPLKNAQPGVYYVIVWAKRNGVPFIASVRTLSLGTRAVSMIASKPHPVHTVVSNAPPDIRTLFFHPDMASGKALPVSLPSSGPPDPSRLFFSPQTAEESKPRERSENSNDNLVDTTELYFDPHRLKLKPQDRSSSAPGQDAAGQKKASPKPSTNKPDPRQLFYTPK